MAKGGKAAATETTSTPAASDESKSSDKSSGDTGQGGGEAAAHATIDELVPPDEELADAAARGEAAAALRERNRDRSIGRAFIGQVPVGDEPQAHINVTESHIVCRPDPRFHLSAVGDIVLANWYGQFDGKTCHVKYGTPLHGLPEELVSELVRTRGVTVGPLPPKLPPNPMQP